MGLYDNPKSVYGAIHHVSKCFFLSFALYTNYNIHTQHIDPYDHELLATFMVRLCHCEECVTGRSSSSPLKQENDRQHSFPPSCPFLRSPFPHHTQENEEAATTAIAEGLHIQSAATSSLRTMAEFLKGVCGLMRLQGREGDKDPKRLAYGLNNEKNYHPPFPSASIGFLSLLSQSLRFSCFLGLSNPLHYAFV